MDVAHNKTIKRMQRFDILEVGMQLTPDELKSAIKNNINLKEGYIKVEKGGTYLKNVTFGSVSRNIRLLIKKRQSISLKTKSEKIKGTILPSRIYWTKTRLLKCEIIVCKHDRTYDKRRTIMRKIIRSELKEIY